MTKSSNVVPIRKKKRELGQIESDIFKTGKRTYEAAIETGRLLAEGQEHFERSSDFFEWAQARFGWSRSAVQQYLSCWEYSKTGASKLAILGEAGITFSDLVRMKTLSEEAQQQVVASVAVGEKFKDAFQTVKGSGGGGGKSRTRVGVGPAAEGTGGPVGAGDGASDSPPSPPRPSPSNEAAKVNVTWEPAYLEGSAGGFDGVTLKVAPDAFAEAARERGWVLAFEVKAAPQTVSATALQEAIDRLAEAQAKIKMLEDELEVTRRAGGDPSKLTREARIARIHADLHGLADRDGCLDTSISREVAAIESTDAVPPSVRDTWDENKTLLISYLFKSITGPQARHWRMVAMRHISPKGFPEATVAERMPIMNNRVAMAEKEKSELAKKSAPAPRKAENLTNQGKAEPQPKPADNKEYGTLLKGNVDYGRQDGGGGKRLNGGSHRGGF